MENYLNLAYSLIEREKKWYSAQNLPYESSFIYAFEKALEEKDRKYRQLEKVLESKDKDFKKKNSAKNSLASRMKTKITDKKNHYKTLINYFEDTDKVKIFKEFYECLDEIYNIREKDNDNSENN